MAVAVATHILRTPGIAEDITWTADDTAAAKTAFTEYLATSHLIYRRDADGGNTQVKEFEPDADELVVIRPLVGG